MRQLFGNIRFYVLCFSIFLSLGYYFYISLTIPSGSLQIIRLTQLYALTAVTYLYFAILGIDAFWRAIVWRKWIIFSVSRKYFALFPTVRSSRSDLYLFHFLARLFIALDTLFYSRSDFSEVTLENIVTSIQMDGLVSYIIIFIFHLERFTSKLLCVAHGSLRHFIHRRLDFSGERHIKT